MTAPMGRLAAGACAALLLGACASPSTSDRASGAPSPSGRHTMADGSKMSDADMQAMAPTPDPAGAQQGGTPDESVPAPGQVTHRDHGPSGAAAMICSREIAEAVQGAFALPAVPRATDGWARGPTPAPTGCPPAP